MRAVVIGTGRIAKQHLLCLKELPGVQVAAVCDLWPALAEAAAERYGIPRWFSDHRAMLDQIQPDAVHVTTPPTSHFPLAMDALDSGAAAIVEKPATVKFDDLITLKRRSIETGRLLVEDYNYLFNDSVQKIHALITAGEFGEVTHVDVQICLDILGKGSPFTDRNAPHPCLSMPGGAIADFLTHLSSLAWLFAGPCKSLRTTWSKRKSDSPLPSDEMRAMLNCQRATASLVFSAHTQPDVFWLRVFGTKMRAEANLFEPRLTIDRMRGGPKPLIPLRNGLAESSDIRRSAFGGLWRKLSGGPGAYEGLWEFLRRTYASLDGNGEPPVSLHQIEEVNRIVADLTNPEYMI